MRTMRLCEAARLVRASRQEVTSVFAAELALLFAIRVHGWTWARWRWGRNVWESPGRRPLCASRCFCDEIETVPRIGTRALRDESDAFRPEGITILCNARIPMSITTCQCISPQGDAFFHIYCCCCVQLKSKSESERQKIKSNRTYSMVFRQCTVLAYQSQHATPTVRQGRKNALPQDKARSSDNVTTDTDAPETCFFVIPMLLDQMEDKAEQGHPWTGRCVNDGNINTDVRPTLRSSSAAPKNSS